MSNTAGLKNKGTKPACGCLKKTQSQLAAKSIGAVIENSFIWDGEAESGRCLTQKLSKNGKRFFISINIDPLPWECSSIIFTIDKAEYKKRKRSHKRDVTGRRSREDVNERAIVPYADEDEEFTAK